MSEHIRGYIRKALENGFTPDAIIVKLVNSGHDKEEVTPLIVEESEKHIKDLEKRKKELKKDPKKVLSEILVSVAFFSGVGTLMYMTLVPAIMA